MWIFSMAMVLCACKLVHKAEKRRFKTLTGPYLWDMYLIDDLQRWCWKGDHIERAAPRT